MLIALPTVSFSFEEWSSTDHLFCIGDDTDKDAAAHFVGFSDNNDDDMPYDELKDDPESLVTISEHFLGESVRFGLLTLNINPSIKLADVSRLRAYVHRQVVIYY